MKDIKEFYNLINTIWQFVKHTSAPEQDDQEAWDRIVDESNRLCREFTSKMADWMEMLRDESLRGTT